MLALFPGPVNADVPVIVTYIDPTPLNAAVGDTVRIAGVMNGGTFKVYWETVDPENEVQYTVPVGIPMGAFDFELIVPPR